MPEDLLAKPAEPLAVPGSMAELPKKLQPFVEVGVTGLQRTRGTGYIFEEWLNQLSTYRARQIYREMRDNDAVIGSMFFALEMILRRAEWSVEAADGSAKAEGYAKFVRECMEDMSHTWQDFVAECVSMYAFGFALFETVYKKRSGADGKKASRFDDGLIGWRKMAPRAQESILYWIWDDEGGLQGAVQLAAPDYRTVPMPIEKLLLVRTTSLKNNPEGRSILRNCYRSWFFKRRIEEVEGIGIERDICGYPVLSVTAELLTAWGNGSQANGMALAQKMVTNVRQDDQMGLVLPQAFDDKNNPQVKFELVKAAGRSKTDPGAAIKRYNEDILNTSLCGFIQFGQTEHGARSLHMSATQIFANALQASLDSIASVMNRIAVTRLMALNGMDLGLAPKLVPGEIGVRDLEETANYVLKLSQAGVPMADPTTADYLRKLAKLPEEPEDVTGEMPLDGDRDEQMARPQKPVPQPRKPGVPVKQKPQGTAPAASNAEAEDDLETAT